MPDEDLVKIVLSSLIKSFQDPNWGGLFHNVLLMMGHTFTIIGDPRNAAICKLKGFQYIPNLTDEKMETLYHNMISDVLRDLRIIGQAREWANKAIKLAEKSGVAEVKLITYVLMGKIESRDGDHRKAMRWFEMARDLADLVGSEQRESYDKMIEEYILRAQKRMRREE